MYLRNSLPCTSSIPCHILAICQAYVIYQVKLKFHWIFFFLIFSLFPINSSVCVLCSLPRCCIYQAEQTPGVVPPCQLDGGQIFHSNDSLHLTLGEFDASLSGFSTKSISGRSLFTPPHTCIIVWCLYRINFRQVAINISQYSSALFSLSTQMCPISSTVVKSLCDVAIPLLCGFHKSSSISQETRGQLSGIPSLRRFTERSWWNFSDGK